MDETCVAGRWQKSHEDERRQFYSWRWDADVAVQPPCGPPANFERTPFRGKRTLTVKAPGLGICIEERQLELENPKPGMDDCWKNLPGEFLPWFVLCQNPQRMMRSDIEHAENAIWPGQEVRYDLLRKYAGLGLLKQQGHAWAIAESRGVLSKLPGGECQLQFCGNPCILWGLFRLMHDRHRRSHLPVVEVEKSGGDPPFLSMRWEGELQRNLRNYLETHEVRIVPDLWRQHSK